jgi:cytochrome P450
MAIKTQGHTSMVATTTPHPTTHADVPGPRGLASLRTIWAFMRSTGLPLNYIQQMKDKHGDVVHFNVAGRSIYAINHPDLIQEILVRRVQDFHKLGVESEKPTALGLFLGKGILTADYDEWKPQRKLIQPLMHAKHIQNYADTMTQFAEQLISQWQDGIPRDIHQDMTQVTMWIIAETMFGTTLEASEGLKHTGDLAQGIAVDTLTKSIMLPGAAKRRDEKIREINADLDRLVQRLMADRPEVSDRADLLTLLMNTKDEDGQPVGYDFIRNNILTLFLAGHETTANSLTWAFYYLARNPHIAEKMYAEIDRVLAGRAARLADLPNLPYTLMVLKEAMRIEPVVSIVPRMILEDVTLGNYTLKARSVVLLPIYVAHHDERWWPEPYVFNPDRFAPEEEAKQHKYAYMPFGGGPRVCIGNHFAMMEAQIILATIASRFKLTLASQADPEPIRLITTFPKDGLMMKIEERHPAPEMA